MPFAAPLFFSVAVLLYAYHINTFPLLCLSPPVHSIPFRRGASPGFSVANRVVAYLFRCSALPRSSLPLLFCDISCDSITCRVYSIPLPFSSLRRTSASFHFRPFPVCAIPFRFTLFPATCSVPCRSFATVPFPQVCHNQAIPLLRVLTSHRAEAQ